MSKTRELLWATFLEQVRKRTGAEPRNFLGAMEMHEECFNEAWTVLSAQPQGDYYTRLLSVMDEIAQGKQVTHEDHPLRLWDRTCPACMWEEAVCRAPATGEQPQGEAGELVKDLRAEADRLTDGYPIHGLEMVAIGVTMRKAAVFIEQHAAPQSEHRGIIGNDDSLKRAAGVAPPSAESETATAIEFGYRCCEKGMNLQAALAACPEGRRDDGA